MVRAVKFCYRRRPGETEALSIGGAELSFDSTVLVSGTAGQALSFTNLDGLAVVSALEGSRVLQPGVTVTVGLAAGGFIAETQPSEPAPYSPNVIDTAALEGLPRQISLPEQNQFSPQPTIVGSTDAPPTGCEPLRDWHYIYTVQRGDTLSAIAGKAGIELSALQSANCITNPNRITPGDQLRLPRAPDDSPLVIEGLVASRTEVARGQCALLEWGVADASVVSLDGGVPLPHAGTQEVCPEADTTYTLRVVSLDGNLSEYSITVTVNDQPGSS